MANIGNMQLERGWPYGSHTWKPGMDRNLQKLAYMTHLSVSSRTTAIPEEGAVGDCLIDPATGYVNIWDQTEDGEFDWLVIVPPKGALAYVDDTDSFDAYVGDPLNWQTVFDPNTAVPAPQPRSVALFVPGKVIPDFVLYTLPTRVSVDFAANLAGSVGFAEVGPSSSVTLLLTKNGVEVGAITFAAGQQSAVFTAPAPISFVEGDILRVKSPVNTFGMANMAVTIKGTVPGV